MSFLPKSKEPPRCASLDCTNSLIPGEREWRHAFCADCRDDTDTVLGTLTRMVCDNDIKNAIPITTVFARDFTKDMDEEQEMMFLRVLNDFNIKDAEQKLLKAKQQLLKRCNAAYDAADKTRQREQQIQAVAMALGVFGGVYDSENDLEYNAQMLIECIESWNGTKPKRKRKRK